MSNYEIDSRDSMFVCFKSDFATQNQGSPYKYFNCRQFMSDTLFFKSSQ